MNNLKETRLAFEEALQEGTAVRATAQTLTRQEDNLSTQQYEFASNLVDNIEQITGIDKETYVKIQNIIAEIRTLVGMETEQKITGSLEFAVSNTIEVILAGSREKIALTLFNNIKEGSYEFRELIQTHPALEHLTLQYVELTVKAAVGLNSRQSEETPPETLISKPAPLIIEHARLVDQEFDQRFEKFIDHVLYRNNPRYRGGGESFLMYDLIAWRNEYFPEFKYVSVSELLSSDTQIPEVGVRKTSVLRRGYHEFWIEVTGANRIEIKFKDVELPKKEKEKNSWYSGDWSGGGEE